jgi:hypothetical protein
MKFVRRSCDGVPSRMKRVAAYDGGRGGWAGSPGFVLGARWALVGVTWARPLGRE